MDDIHQITPVKHTMLKLLLTLGLFAVAAQALPAASKLSHHTDTAGGSVVEVRVPASELESIEAITHEIWLTKCDPHVCICCMCGHMHPNIPWVSGEGAATQICPQHYRDPGPDRARLA